MVPLYRSQDLIPEFIDPRTLPAGYPLVAIGGAVNASNLKLAYQNGIFPFPQDDQMPIPWVSMDPRGILFTDLVRRPRSLIRQIRKACWKFSINKAFPEVIALCASLRPSSWITAEMLLGYTELFHQGHVLSFEVWNNHKLVGGLYGVSVDGTFAGESMFHLESGASKAAILFACHFLNQQKISFIDTQMLTSPVALMGGVEISRTKFLDLLKQNKRPGFQPVVPTDFLQYPF